jgi:hypothetical protein
MYVEKEKKRARKQEKKRFFKCFAKKKHKNLKNEKYIKRVRDGKMHII